MRSIFYLCCKIDFVKWNRKVIFSSNKAVFIFTCTWLSEIFAKIFLRLRAYTKNFIFKKGNLICVNLPFSSCQIYTTQKSLTKKVFIPWVLKLLVHVCNFFRVIWNTRRFQCKSAVLQTTLVPLLSFKLHFKLIKSILTIIIAMIIINVQRSKATQN